MSDADEAEPSFFKVMAKPDVEPGLVRMAEAIVNEPEFAQRVADAAAHLAVGLPVTLPDGRIITY